MRLTTARASKHWRCNNILQSFIHSFSLTHSIDLNSFIQRDLRFWIKIKLPELLCYVIWPFPYITILFCDFNQLKIYINFILFLMNNHCLCTVTIHIQIFISSVAIRSSIYILQLCSDFIFMSQISHNSCCILSRQKVQLFFISITIVGTRAVNNNEMIYIYACYNRIHLLIFWWRYEEIKNV